MCVCVMNGDNRPLGTVVTTFSCPLSGPRDRRVGKFGTTFPCFVSFRLFCLVYVLFCPVVAFGARRGRVAGVKEWEGLRGRVTAAAPRLGFPHLYNGYRTRFNPPVVTTSSEPTAARGWRGTDADNAVETGTR